MPITNTVNYLILFIIMIKHRKKIIFKYKFYQFHNHGSNYKTRALITKRRILLSVSFLYLILEIKFGKINFKTFELKLCTSPFK